MKLKNFLKRGLGSKEDCEPERTYLNDLGLVFDILWQGESGKKKIFGLALTADAASEGRYFINDLYRARTIEKKFKAEVKKGIRKSTEECPAKARMTIYGNQVFFRIKEKGQPEERVVSFFQDACILAKLKALIQDKYLEKELIWETVNYDNKFGPFDFGFQIICKPEKPAPEPEPVPI